MTHWRQLPRTVFILGLVSLLMDLSSETIHTLLPLFMVSQLGLSVMTVGVVDGVAEALTLMIKPYAGWLSDRSRRRKPMTLIGYGLSAFSKPFFALAAALPLILFARLLDRLGKGLRGAPRDALIADITPPAQRGAAYGLRQSLDTIGALLAPLAATVLMLIFHNQFQIVFWIACLPALASVILLATRVREPNELAQASSNTPKMTQAGLPLWPLFVLGALLSCTRIPEAFLVLRAQQSGFALATAPLVMVAMNLCYVVSAFPAGRWFDRWGAERLLPPSMLLLLAAETLLALAHTPALCLIGAMLFGLHMGTSQGVIAALIAQRAPPQHRARSFGWYALCAGSALMLSGAFSGWLWDHYSSTTSFAFAAGLSALTGLIAIPLLRKNNEY